MTGVSFRHDGDRLDSDWTLRDIDIAVPAGTSAIVGGTGAGNTTRAHLVARPRGVDERAVLLDGHHVGELTVDSVSDVVGLAAQDTNLHAAVRAIRIDRVVVSLPRGYDNVAGARGHRFSGGERPRPAIARTARAGQAALDELACGRTTIAIAHRLSS